MKSIKGKSMGSSSSSSSSSKYVCIVYVFSVILLLILLRKLFDHNEPVTVLNNINDINDIINNDNDIEYSEMLKDDIHKIILDWTPRAACSAMVAMFLKGMNIYQNVNYSGFVHDYRMKQFYKQYGHVNKNEFLDKSWYKFKVVRDPYSRAVSSYFAVMTDTFLSRNMFDGKPYSYLRDIATFEEFIDIYEKEYLDKKATFIGMSHIDKQSRDIEWDIFQKHHKHAFNTIIKLENFNNGIDIVNHNTGMNYNLGNYSDSHNNPHHNDLSTYYGNASLITFVKGNKEIKRIDFIDIKCLQPDYKTFYNDIMKQKIKRIFYQDFLIYNYDF